MINDTRAIEIKIIEENTSNKERLSNFLIRINNDYPVPISEKVDIAQYVDKIFSLGIVLVASIEGNILGVSTFYANDLINKEGCISLLGVLNNYRRIGIANKLTLVSFQIMKAQGMITAYTFTHKNNQRAISFYERMGFVIDEDRPNQYEYNISLSKKLDF